MWKQYTASVLVYLFYRVLMMTWRIRFDECAAFQQALKDRTPVILAHWHGDELAVIHLVKRYRIATITSTSKDGEIMNRVLQWLGAQTSRGSSTRGGASALRGIIGHCKRNGNNVSFAVDGPKGPIYKVKPGVFEFSRLMNAPIFVVSVGISNPWIFNRSWNKCALPGFFSKVLVSVQEGMPVVGRDVDPRDPLLAQQLEQLLADGKKLQCQVVSRDRP